MPVPVVIAGMDIVGPGMTLDTSSGVVMVPEAVDD